MEKQLTLKLQYPVGHIHRAPLVLVLRVPFPRTTILPPQTSRRVLYMLIYESTHVCAHMHALPTPQAFSRTKILGEQKKKRAMPWLIDVPLSAILKSIVQFQH